MDWTTETFQVNGHTLLYKDVDSYDVKLDINGNPTYTLYTHGRSGSYECKQRKLCTVKRSDAYAFDPHRVMNRTTKDRLLIARGEL